ncbi:MAG: hypothetical protein Q7W51_05760 [Coriobacteriia bacterium]|nr:hypothetical protein [Coriobacteriia bacterium]
MSGKRYSDQDRVTGLAAVELFGSLAAAERASGYSRKTLARWREEADGEERDDAREFVAKAAEGVEPRLARIVDAYLERLEANVRNIAPRDLPVGLGILVDKLERFRGRAEAVPDMSRSSADIARDIEAILRDAHAAQAADTPTPDEQEDE